MEPDFPSLPDYPSLLARVQAIFIDGILIIVSMFIFSAILDKYENVPDWVRIVLFFGLWAVYEPVCLTLFGCTLGQYIKGLRVRKYPDFTQRINLLQAFVRYIFKAVLGWLSFLSITTNTERRAIHDFISGSVVVKK